MLLVESQLLGSSEEQVGVFRFYSLSNRDKLEILKLERVTFIFVF